MRELETQLEGLTTQQTLPVKEMGERKGNKVEKGKGSHDG